MMTIRKGGTAADRGGSADGQERKNGGTEGRRDRRASKYKHEEGAYIRKRDVGCQTRRPHARRRGNALE